MAYSPQQQPSQGKGSKSTRRRDLSFSPRQLEHANAIGWEGLAVTEFVMRIASAGGDFAKAIHGAESDSSARVLQ